MEKSNFLDSTRGQQLREGTWTSSDLVEQTNNCAMIYSSILLSQMCYRDSRVGEITKEMLVEKDKRHEEWLLNITLRKAKCNIWT